MALRDLKGLHKGAFLGFLWVVISPLFQVVMYVIIVTFIFGSRLQSSSSTFGYAVYVLSGMIPWQIITKGLQEAPSLIRNRVELVKQVIYPVETLPLSSLIFGAFGSLVSFVIFLGLSAISGSVSWSYLLLPIPFVLLLAFILSVSWIFSIVGVLIKDLREIVTVTLGVLVYFSPVVAMKEIVGERIWMYIMFNPLSHIVVCFRDVYNVEFHSMSWLIFFTMTLLSFVMGGWVMTRAKIHINEYI